jgi:RNA polymerase subunit RPABC4/transcription elongation factor Spt4
LEPLDEECPQCGQLLCPECQAAIAEDDTACPTCKVEFEYACPQCEASISADAETCPNCGFEF